jgi:hypothetical protein
MANAVVSSLTKRILFVFLVFAMPVFASPCYQTKLGVGAIEHVPANSRFTVDISNGLLYVDIKGRIVIGEFHDFGDGNYRMGDQGNFKAVASDKDLKITVDTIFELDRVGEGGDSVVVSSDRHSQPASYTLQRVSDDVCLDLVEVR